MLSGLNGSFRKKAPSIFERRQKTKDLMDNGGAIVSSGLIEETINNTGSMMKRQHSLSLSVKSSWTQNQTKAQEVDKTPVQLLQSGFFDVSIIMPRGGGSLNSADKLVAKTAKNVDKTSALSTLLNTPDKVEKAVNCSTFSSQAMTLQQKVSCSPETPHTIYKKPLSMMIGQSYQRTEEDIGLDDCESRINDFFENEAVRTVMLADYLKALGIHQETLKYKESQSAILRKKVC